MTYYQRAETFLDVLGYLPEDAKAIGEGVPSAHCDFINRLRDVLQYMPTHEVAQLSLTDLKKKHPFVKSYIMMYSKITANY